MLKIGRSFQNSLSKKDEQFILNTTIKVMVVDQNIDSLSHVRNLLESLSFGVTCVDHVAVALRILSKKKERFDLLLIDKDLKDVDIHTFLLIAENMDVMSSVMYEEEDDVFLLQALRNGACDSFKKPLTMEGALHARDNVLRKRLCNFNKFKKLVEGELIEKKNASFSFKGQDSGDARRIIRNAREDYSLQQNITDGAPKKISVEWTKELHDKFLNAIVELGENRCYPKDIQEKMGVPGLTRAQVASHLQKCRKDGQRTTRMKARIGSSSNRSRTFGCIPIEAQILADRQKRIRTSDATSSNYESQLHMNSNNINDQPVPNSSSHGGQSLEDQTIPPIHASDEVENLHTH